LTTFENFCTNCLTWFFFDFFKPYFSWHFIFLYLSTLIVARNWSPNYSVLVLLLKKLMFKAPTCCVPVISFRFPFSLRRNNGHKQGVLPPNGCNVKLGR
jgi:hypothetical protein